MKDVKFIEYINHKELLRSVCHVLDISVVCMHGTELTEIHVFQSLPLAQQEQVIRTLVTS